MHNFITEVGRVLLVRRNTTIQAGVLQKHNDFFRRRKLFLVREILVLREQESARFELPDLFLIGGIFSVQVLVFGPVSRPVRQWTLGLFSNIKLWIDLVVH